MKGLKSKDIMIALFIGTLGITTVLASNGIKSASLSNAKVTIDGDTIPLNDKLIAVTKDNESDAQLYMPTREILEYLGYGVSWDSEHNTVNLTSKQEIVNKTVAKKEDNQVVSVDVSSIEPNACKEIGVYTLNSNTTIYYNVGATGKGLAIGFVKSTDNPSTASNNYFTQAIFGENAVINNDVSVPPSLAGSYKLYVKNVGEKTLTNITGSVKISNPQNSPNPTNESNTDTVPPVANVEYQTVDVDISNADKALKGGANTPINNYYYYAFGPYTIKQSNLDVIVDVKNGVDGSIFIGTSPNKELTQGVTNTFTNEPYYKGNVGIFADNDGNYYVIIGAKDIKNLRGSIKIPASN